MGLNVNFSFSRVNEKVKKLEKQSSHLSSQNDYFEQRKAALKIEKKKIEKDQSNYNNFAYESIFCVRLHFQSLWLKFNHKRKSIEQP